MLAPRVANPFGVAASLFEQGAAARAKPWTPQFYQVPPAGDWGYWLLLAGRGTGKSDAGAYDMVQHVKGPPCLRGSTPHRMAIIAPTLGDAVEACWKEPAGISAHDPRARLVTSKGGSIVRWPDGSEAKLFGAYAPDDVERLRAGGNRCRAWAEEFAAWRYLDQVWNQLMFGLRLGRNPQVVVTTTPKPKQRLKELMADPRSVMALTQDGRRPTTDDNPYLPESKRRELYQLYGGSRIGRQELNAELLDDVPGALWTLAQIDALRVTDHPDLMRIVVAIDPAMTSSEGAAETGIIVAGIGLVANDQHDSTPHPHGYLLEDVTLRGTPNAWGMAAIAAYNRHRADLIVGEVNNGGEMIEHVVRGISRDVSYRAVHATRGKAKRAEPISSLYEQAKVHHVGFFPEVEDQMTTWVPEEEETSKSPDRMDALVWALTELMPPVAPARSRSTLPTNKPPVVVRGDLRLVGERYVDKAPR